MTAVCTAPKTGRHKEPRTKAMCPVCGVSAYRAVPDGRFGAPVSTSPLNMGKVSVATGRSVPGHAQWGQVQDVDEMAPGIVAASCSGHGGIKLSAQRNKMIPEALRNDDGWYEEDCEASIVVAFFPEVFDRDGDWQKEMDDAIATIKNYFPDKWAEATGEEVTLEESSALRDRAEAEERRRFLEGNKDSFVTQGHQMRYDWVPGGYTTIDAVRPSDGKKGTFLVPSEVVKGLNGESIVVDDRFLDLGDVKKIGVASPRVRPEPISGEQVEVSYDGMTYRQHDRAYAAMHKLWRWPDCETMTLIERMRYEGVTHKEHMFGGKSSLQYYIHFADGSMTNISKPAYDALASVPEDMEPGDHKGVEADRLSQRLDRARRSWPRDRAKEQALEDKRRAASEEARLLRAESDKARGGLDLDERNRAQSERVYEVVGRTHNIDIAPENHEAWKHLLEQQPDLPSGGADPSLVEYVKIMFPDKEK